MSANHKSGKELNSTEGQTAHLVELLREAAAGNGKYHEMIVGWLGERLGFPIVFIAELRHGEAEMLALHGPASAGASGGLKDLALALCRGVKADGMVCRFDEVQRLFPQVQALQNCGARTALGFPCFDGAGTPIAVLCTVDAGSFDADRDEALLLMTASCIGRERARLLSERRIGFFRKAIETTKVGITMADEEMKITYCNPADAEMHGYRPEELLGKRSNILGPPELRGSETLEEIELSGTKRRESVNMRKDGSRFPVYLVSDIVRDDAGMPVGLVTTCEDITAEKRERELLVKTKDRFALVLSATKDGIWDRDLVTGEVYFSPRWKAMLGYGEDEFPDKMERFYDIVHPEDRERLRRNVNDYLDGKAETYRIEFRLKHRNGEYRWIDARGAVTRDETGRPLRFAGSHSDVTEKKRMEEELLRQERIHSIGLLAGGIAHDFNNILTAVLTNVEAAREFLRGDLDEESMVFGLMENAFKAITRATGLTRQLSALSKGGAPIIESASIEQLIRESAGLVLTGSNVRSRCFFPDDLKGVKIDAGQISQVLNNLILNAREAMPKGGTVVVRAENVQVEKDSSLPLDGGDYVKVSVRDTGCGIAPEDLPRLFDPYFTKKRGGSGLGLTTSYAIVKRHGGHIAVESRPGAGTLVMLYLPASASAVEGAVRNPEQAAHGSGRRLLIMDDEELIVEAMRMAAEGAGYDVEHAFEGKGMLKKYRQAMKEGRPFDAVIMDLTIPGGMGGEEAVGRLLEIDPAARAIVCSGYSDTPVMADYERYGFREVIQKPFTRGILLEKITAAVRNGTGTGRS